MHCLCCFSVIRSLSALLSSTFAASVAACACPAPYPGPPPDPHGAAGVPGPRPPLGAPPELNFIPMGQAGFQVSSTALHVYEHFLTGRLRASM